MNATAGAADLPVYGPPAPSPEPLFSPDDLTYSYTRAQALDDGVLVDVTERAAEAGFRIPVAVTRHVWDDCVEVPLGREGTQDETGRLWDVVWMASLAARQNRGEDRGRFQVSVVTAKGRRTCSLVLVVGPGDEAEPVTTIMFPEDD